LWDKTSYVLGLSEKKSARIRKLNEAFIALNLFLLEGENAKDLVAFRKFLCTDVSSWESAISNAPDGFVDSNVVFRLDGQKRYIHECDEALEIHSRITLDGYSNLWKEFGGNSKKPELASALQKSTASRACCLITGENETVARLHPS